MTISGAGHRKRFDAIFDRTGGHATFLGDWHTHPASPASPSRQDLVAMKQLAEDPDYGTPQPLIAIVSTGRFRRQLAHPRWWWRPDDESVCELEARPYDGARINH